MNRTGPMTGTSKRLSWAGLEVLTTTAPVTGDFPAADDGTVRAFHRFNGHNGFFFDHHRLSDINAAHQVWQWSTQTQCPLIHSLWALVWSTCRGALNISLIKRWNRERVMPSFFKRSATAAKIVSALRSRRASERLEILHLI